MERQNKMRENEQRSDFKKQREDNMGKVEEMRTKTDEETRLEFKIDKMRGNEGETRKKRRLK